MKAAELPNNEIKRLQVLDELDILDTLEEQAYDDLTALAATICDTPIALVSLIDKDRQWFKSHYGLDVRETPREFAFCAHAILENKIFIVEDSSKDKRFFDNPLVTSEPNVMFYAGVPLMMESGMNMGTLCVIDNKAKTITDRQKKSLQALARQVVSQLELRMKIKELQDLDNAKDEFISMVSHELRTPLTALCGSLSLLLNGQAGHLDDTPRSMIELSSRNAERLLALVNDILDLAKIEAGKFELCKNEFSLEAFLNKVVDLNKPYAEKCNCRIRFVNPETVNAISLVADEKRLMQVLSNLISNAAKFTYDGDCIEVSARRDGANIEFKVTDHGPGISDSAKKELFTMFKQLSYSNNRKLPGTGIGLNICKQIIELHGGFIDYESIPDEHTSFCLTLPV